LNDSPAPKPCCCTSTTSGQFQYKTDCLARKTCTQERRLRRATLGALETQSLQQACAQFRAESTSSNIGLVCRRCPVPANTCETLGQTETGDSGQAALAVRDRRTTQWSPGLRLRFPTARLVPSGTRIHTLGFCSRTTRSRLHIFL